MKISFNLRLGYHESIACSNKMQELGGIGGVVGGSSYNGTKEQIQDLLMYMEEKEYDMSSLAIDEEPCEARARRVKELKKKGII